jgi:hypothetical protein
MFGVRNARIRQDGNKIARWWHNQQHTSSERTPLARMLPSVIGSIGSLMRLAAIRRLYGGRHGGTTYYFCG